MAQEGCRCHIAAVRCRISGTRRIRIEPTKYFRASAMALFRGGIDQYRPCHGDVRTVGV